MKRQDDIEALLKRARADLEKVRAEYDQSLRKKTVAPDLRIDIKNLCGNLRSVLDYLACEIRESHCTSAKEKCFYFPILPSRQLFEARVEGWFPRLRTNAPDLWDYLESLQPYHDGNEWLDQFNRVNNENKHGSLVEQTRTETPRVTVETQGGGNVSWDPRAVKFGPGVYIDGVPVDPSTQMPVPHPSHKVTRAIWVDFLFEGIGVSAIGLLRSSMDGVSGIAAAMAKRLP